MTATLVVCRYAVYTDDDPPEHVGYVNAGAGGDCWSAAWTPWGMKWRTFRTPEAAAANLVARYRKVQSKIPRCYGCGKRGGYHEQRGGEPYCWECLEYLRAGEK